jgi:hypothetical protein
MSFHRKAFLIWLAVMTPFVVTVSAIGIYYPANDQFQANAMDELIEVAMGHAKDLRDGTNATSDHSTQSAEKEAERWEWLAVTARMELLNLRPKQFTP